MRLSAPAGHEGEIAQGARAFPRRALRRGGLLRCDTRGLVAPPTGTVSTPAFGATRSHSEPEMTEMTPATIDSIPVAHTPAGGYTTFPPAILAGCAEPVPDGAPDLRGF